MMADEQPRLKCKYCGRTYKNLLTFLRHKCAKRLQEKVEEMIGAGDSEGIRAMASGQYELEDE